MKNKLVDLHVHSNASDGTLSPAEVVDEAIAAGLSAFALTDHDNTQGVAETIAAGKKRTQEGKLIEVIPGIELSLGFEEKDIHVVGLFVDITHPTFQKETAFAVREREMRNEKMVQNLRHAGIRITMEDLQDGNAATVITRAHFAKAIIAKGYTETVKETFDKFLNPDTPYYVPRTYITPERGIELILMAGGVPILAHPFLYKLPDDKLRALLVRLKKAGLVGMEVYYSEFDEKQTAYALELAKEYDLVPSGGSDFHGSNKPHIKLGHGIDDNLAIPYSILEELRNRRHE